MVWRCACDLDVILTLIFVTFSTLRTLAFSDLRFYEVYRQWLPCKCNSLYSFMPIFLKLCTCFCHGLEMCMWFEFNPAVNFCHFSFHFVNLVIFRRCDINFTKVQSIFFSIFWKFSLLVAMTFNQIDRLRQKLMFGRGPLKKQFPKNFYQNICDEIVINANFHFSHYKSMETLSCHSNGSTWATAIKTYIL